MNLCPDLSLPWRAHAKNNAAAINFAVARIRNTTTACCTVEKADGRYEMLYRILPSPPLQFEAINHAFSARRTHFKSSSRGLAVGVATECGRAVKRSLRRHKTRWWILPSLEESSYTDPLKRYSAAQIGATRAGPLLTQDRLIPSRGIAVRCWL